MQYAHISSGTVYVMLNGSLDIAFKPTRYVIPRVSCTNTTAKMYKIKVDCARNLTSDIGHLLVLYNKLQLRVAWCFMRLIILIDAFMKTLCSLFYHAWQLCGGFCYMHKG